MRLFVYSVGKFGSRNYQQIGANDGKRSSNKSQPIAGSHSKQQKKVATAAISNKQQQVERNGSKQQQNIAYRSKQQQTEANSNKQEQKAANSSTQQHTAANNSRQQLNHQIEVTGSKEQKKGACSSKKW